MRGITFPRILFVVSFILSIQFNAFSSTVSASPIEGTWTTGCAKGPDGYMSFDATFTADKFSTTIRTYGDDQCKQTTYEDKHSGEFAIVGPSSTDPGALMVNFTDIDSNGRRTLAYELVKLVGERLYFGLAPGDSEANRPLAVNMDYPFTKIAAE